MTYAEADANKPNSDDSDLYFVQARNLVLALTLIEHLYASYRKEVRKANTKDGNGVEIMFGFGSILEADPSAGVVNSPGSYPDTRNKFVEDLNEVLNASYNDRFFTSCIDTWLMDNSIRTEEELYTMLGTKTLEALINNASCYQSKVIGKPDALLLRVWQCGKCAHCEEPRKTLLSRMLRENNLPESSTWQSRFFA